MRWNQVTVPTLELERSIFFYQTLGLKLIVKSPHYASFEVGDGSATFSLQVTDNANGPAAGRKSIWNAKIWLPARQT